MIYKCQFTAEAKAQFLSITDKRIQTKLIERIAKLAEEPDKQGKALVDDLMGCRSVRAVGQRYRIVYQVKQSKVLVLVVSLGLRKDGDKKDVYRLAQKLLKAGLLES